MKPASFRKRASRRPAWGKLLIGIVVLAALAAAWRWTPLADYLTRQNLSAWSRAIAAMPWAPLVVVLAYTPASFLLFPRPALTLLTVISFGAWSGFVYSGLGILLAALATYYAGRLMRRDTVHRIAGDGIDDVSDVLDEHGVMAVFAANMVPVPPFVVQGIVAGAVRMNVWKYTAGSILGMAPGLLAATIFARELRNVLEDPSALSWWVIASVVIAFAVFTVLIRRWLKKRMPAKDHSAGRPHET